MPLHTFQPVNPPGADCWPNNAQMLNTGMRSPACVAASPPTRRRLRRLVIQANNRCEATIKFNGRRLLTKADNRRGTTIYSTVRRLLRDAYLR